LNNRNEKNIIIPKISSMDSFKNGYRELSNNKLIKPEIELNKKENNTIVGYNQQQEVYSYQNIQFTNYSNTFRNATSQLFEPHLLSFSEFKLMDISPQQQRLSLYVLRKQETRLLNDGIIKPLSKDEMKIKKKSASEPKDKIKSGNSFTRFLLKKKSKHSSSETFHLLQLAIHDNRIASASTLLNNITYSNMKKKKYQEINKAFLYAMTKKLENISMMFLNKGFPDNVNRSIFDVSINTSKKQKKMNTLQFPSYFILAVSLGLMDVVKFMIK
ncbi:hypothetical protein BCR36DRAFT_244058, partial [Piromyces finnis]